LPIALKSLSLKSSNTWKAVEKMISTNL
jgi:hypothetical protein